MTKVEHYRDILRATTDWDAYLRAESRLPGPRANLELAFAAAQEGEEALFLRYAGLDDSFAPTGTPDEFLAFCGVLGLGYLVADGQLRHLEQLRVYASDSRWRIREAVALGLQQYGRVQPKDLIAEMSQWCLGNPLERRAAIAATCEPELLKNPVVAHRIFSLLDRVTASLLEEENRGSEDVRTLRKTLGYAWSVAVAAQPEVGKARMARWFEQQDPDIRWILRENLKKKRLSRMDADWVKEQRSRLA